MLLTITEPPATDLGYWLHKNPGGYQRKAAPPHEPIAPSAQESYRQPKGPRR
jgi:hypothetical protein